MNRICPLHLWPLAAAADLYWWAWRKYQHTCWLASVVVHARQPTHADPATAAESCREER